MELLMKSIKRTKIITLLLFAIAVLLFSAALFILVFDMKLSITLNELHDIKLGDTKIQVITKLADSEIRYVAPRIGLSTSFEEDNQEDIHKIIEPEGLCVNVNKNNKLYVSLMENGDFIIVQHGVKKYNLQEVMAKDEFVEWLRVKIHQNEILDARSCITDLRNVDIKAITNMDIQYLMVFDNLEYQDKDTHSLVVLKFTSKN